MVLELYWIRIFPTTIQVKWWWNICVDEKKTTGIDILEMHIFYLCVCVQFNNSIGQVVNDGSWRFSKAIHNNKGSVFLHVCVQHACIFWLTLGKKERFTQSTKHFTRKNWNERTFQCSGLKGAEISFFYLPQHILGRVHVHCFLN